MSWTVGILRASQRAGTVRANFLCLGMAPSPCPPAATPLGGAWAVAPASKMATVKCELMKNFTSEEPVRNSKISIVGTGSVGMACAVSINRSFHLRYLSRGSLSGANICPKI